MLCREMRDWETVDLGMIPYQCMQYSLYAVFGVCYTHCMLYPELTVDHYM
jgi:hypothetical protein